MNVAAVNLCSQIGLGVVLGVSAVLGMPVMTRGALGSGLPHEVSSRLSQTSVISFEDVSEYLTTLDELQENSGYESCVLRFDGATAIPFDLSDLPTPEQVISDLNQLPPDAVLEFKFDLSSSEALQASLRGNTSQFYQFACTE